MYGFYDLVAILFLVWVFYLLGFRIVRANKSHEDQVEQPTVESANTEHSPLQRRQILLDSLNEPPYTDILTPRQRDRLRYSLLNPGDTWIDPAPAAEFEDLVSAPAEPAPQPASPSLPDFSPTLSTSAPQYRAAPEPALIASSAVTAPPRVEIPPSAPPKPPRTPVMDTIRANWDPAVMMLYLGALLVVVAGLIFATYNWGALGAWQKLGMLAAGTAAFLIAGFAIRNIERVKPASTTFIIIGGLLVPANFLAAYTVFDEVQPAMPLFFGAIATTVIHAMLSYQPGARIFRYSAVGAALVAIASIPAAFGFAGGWGGVIGLVAIALIPDHLFGQKRFRHAWIVISRSAAGPLAGFAIWQGWNDDGWMVAGALVGVSLVATRFSQRYTSLRTYLLALSDLALIAASVQIAHNFDGDRWLIAAGLLALTLVLLQESIRFRDAAQWFEFAAAVSAAALAGEIVRVLGTDMWAVASGFGVLTALMLIHSRRYEATGVYTEGVAAFALPVSLGTAAYAIDPSLWNAVIGLATLTISSVWLGLRRMYSYNWPGGIATTAALGTTILLLPAFGLDWGWGCVAAIFVVALAPYPFGRLSSFSQPWLRIANVLVVPLALFAIWRGVDGTDWIVPVTLVAISMWFARLARERVFDSNLMLVMSDLFAVAAAVGTAWVLRGDQWILATVLLGISLVLVKRSFTWPELAQLLQFGAAVSISLFVGEVTSQLADRDWAMPAAAIALTVGMLVYARLHPRHGWFSEFIATWSLPLAVASGIWAYNESWWWVPVGAGVLTLTMVVHRIRHVVPGDLNLAIASLAGITAALSAGELLGVRDDSRQFTAMLMALALVLTVLANVVLPRFTTISGWLRNVIRLETLPIFLTAGVVGELDNGLLYVVVILVMFWNIWVGRTSFWSLPMAFTMWVAMVETLVPESASNHAHLWWYLALAVSCAALAWQLDRKSQDTGEQLHAGVYLWLVVSLISTVLLLSTFHQMINSDSSVHNGITLFGVAVLHVIGFWSTGGRVFLVPAGFLVLAANFAWIFGGVTNVEHGVLAAVALAVAFALYRQASMLLTWAGFVALNLGLIYIQLAGDFAFSRDLLLGLVVAWILVSLAIVRWRTGETDRLSIVIFYQAMWLHGIALIVPTLDRTAIDISRPDLVLVLVSLAGVVATSGALRKSRELVLTGSAIGMSALMLQINIGTPGNLHAYTVPLSIYLLAVGLLLRRDPRIANTLLAAGSAILVVPAMVEALTTGEIAWLWVALAESIGLFLFGTILRLRIPTAAGVIAVSVIALRMLVFAVSVLASWVSILAIGVALLFIGTMWLIFRESIQVRARGVFSRWQRFD